MTNMNDTLVGGIKDKVLYSVSGKIWYSIDIAFRESNIIYNKFRSSSSEPKFTTKIIHHPFPFKNFWKDYEEHWTPTICEIKFKSIPFELGGQGQQQHTSTDAWDILKVMRWDIGRDIGRKGAQPLHISLSKTQDGMAGVLLHCPPIPKEKSVISGEEVYFFLLSCYYRHT